jgi:hypothetical protein
MYAMNSVIELLQQTEGAIFVNEDGLEDSFEVLPALSNEELERFQVSLPCSLPEEIRELLTFASGFKVGGLEEVWFAAEGFGMEEIFPHAVTLAADGFGNFWVVDLTSESRA